MCGPCRVDKIDPLAKMLNGAGGQVNYGLDFRSDRAAVIICFRTMKNEVPFRIILTDPPTGVEFKVQKGRNELLDPLKAVGSGMVFEFSLLADISAQTPNFLGPFAQGPKDSRFIYLNSGTYAGDSDSIWSRRAKLSLLSITKEMVEEIVAGSCSRIETTLSGTGSDGGPICASIKGLVWRVVDK